MIAELTRQIAQTPDCEQLYLERGKRYWQLKDIPHAFADYDTAIRLNPRSTARQLKAMALDILAFYNKEMYNP